MPALMQTVDEHEEKGKNTFISLREYCVGILQGLCCKCNKEVIASTGRKCIRSEVLSNECSS